MPREYPQLKDESELGYYVTFNGDDGTDLGVFGVKDSGDELFLPLRMWKESDKTAFTIQGFGPANHEEDTGEVPSVTPPTDPPIDWIT